MRTTNDLAARLGRLADRVTRVDAAALARPEALPAADPAQPPRCQRATLPVPPSCNRLWRAAGGRVLKSRAYRDWCLRAGPCLAALRPVARLPLLVVVTVYAGKGFSRQSDIDNRVKPVLDLMQMVGVIPGDSVRHVAEVHARYVETSGPRKPCCCTVAVIEGHVVRAEP